MPYSTLAAESEVVSQACADIVNGRTKALKRRLNKITQMTGSTRLYILIGIGAIIAIVIPILLIPVLPQQINNFPEERPCTIVSCAEVLIMNCQPGYIRLSSDPPLGNSLKVNVTGWDGQERCNLGMQLEPGELTLSPIPYHVCAIPKDELRDWNEWRNGAYEGVKEIEMYCKVK